MEAPLRRLAEGYSVNFLSYDGFPSVPGLLHRNFSSAPFPIQPPTPALPGSRLWGVSHISSAQHCVGMFFCIFFLFLSSWALCCVLGSGIHKRASKTELAILHVYEENSIRAVLRAVDVIRIENQMRCSVPVTVLKILLAL